jgi:putative peptidoglycan lipid II flippase
MVLITQLGGLVQTIVASSAVAQRASDVAIASVAAAAIGWLIFMLPHSVATVSIATAYFTRMSTHVHDERIDLLKNDLAAGLRTIALISAISSSALIVLAYPVSRVFVGEYPATIALGNVLIALMIGLLPFSFVFMMQRAFYALEDTRTPFVFTCIQIGLHIFGSVLVFFFVEPTHTVVALSLLTSTTVTIQAITAYLMLRRRIGKLDGQAIASSLARFILAAVFAGLIGYVVLQLIGGTNEGAFAVKSIATSLLADLMVGFAMLAAYLVVLKLMRVAEVEKAISSIKGILRK